MEQEYERDYTDELANIQDFNERAAEGYDYSNDNLGDTQEEGWYLMQSIPKREYDSLIENEIDLIAFFRKYGKPHMVKEAKERLQQWFRLQADQNSIDKGATHNV